MKLFLSTPDKMKPKKPAEARPEEKPVEARPQKLVEAKPKKPKAKKNKKRGERERERQEKRDKLYTLIWVCCENGSSF